jgi:hypothetical protein
MRTYHVFPSPAVERPVPPSKRDLFGEVFLASMPVDLVASELEAFESIEKEAERISGLMMPIVRVEVRKGGDRWGDLRMP